MLSAMFSRRQSLAIASSPEYAFSKKGQRYEPFCKYSPGSHGK